jgi:uncharacterized lipoprotein YajG
MGIQDAIVAQQAAARQGVSVSVIKQDASAQQQVANILAQSAASVPVSNARGGSVNISA